MNKINLNYDVNKLNEKITKMAENNIFSISIIFNFIFVEKMFIILNVSDQDAD